jgi:hypothetical protein
MATSSIQLPVIDLTSSVTWHNNLTKNNLLVKQYGKVVVINGNFTVTGDITNGQVLLNNLPNSGLDVSAGMLFKFPVLSSTYDISVPSKYRLETLRWGMLINATVTLKQGDIIQIDRTYIAV